MEKAVYQFHYIDRLESALQSRLPELDYAKKQILLAIYTMKIQATSQYGNVDESYIQTINAMDTKLGDALQPALVDNPLTVDSESNLNYQINGIDYKFKVDTGAVTSVVDAETIEWKLEPEQREMLEKAYEEYVKKYPDKGAMTQEDLLQLSEMFHGVNFGAVMQFDLVIHRQGKEDEVDLQADPQAPDKIITLTGPFDVVGISNPEVKKGVRMGLRPVIHFFIEGAGFGPGDTYPFSLVQRKKTRRGLASRTQLKEAGIDIVSGKRDTRLIDVDTLDINAVAAALQVSPGYIV